MPTSLSPCGEMVDALDSKSSSESCAGSSPVTGTTNNTWV